MNNLSETLIFCDCATPISERLIYPNLLKQLGLTKYGYFQCRICNATTQRKPELDAVNSNETHKQLKKHEEQGCTSASF